MRDELKNIFNTPNLLNIFQKHCWQIPLKSEKNYHFNYQGEIADYYLIITHSFNIIKFDYTLDIYIPNDKLDDLLILINFVNKKYRDGFFIYDIETNKIKFYINKQYLVKLKTRIIEDLIEDNLNITNPLFRNFALATHYLIYAEKIDQSYLELMFLEIEGYA